MSNKKVRRTYRAIGVATAEVIERADDWRMIAAALAHELQQLHDVSLCPDDCRICDVLIDYRMARR
jgi:hypothetical protein